MNKNKRLPSGSFSLSRALSLSTLLITDDMAVLSLSLSPPAHTRLFCFFLENRPRWYVSSTKEHRNILIKKIGWMLMQAERNEDSRVSCQKTAHHSPSLIASSSNEFLLITIAHQRMLSESRAQQSSSNLIQSLELGTVTFAGLIVLFAIITCQCFEVMHLDKERGRAPCAGRL